MSTRPLLVSLVLLVGCTAGSGADSAVDSVPGGLDGDVPPFPAVNSATIRSGGVDTTFECVGRTSGFRTVTVDSGSALSLYCASDDSDPDNLAVFQLTDSGDVEFGVGTYTDRGNLQVVVVVDGVTWMAVSKSSSVLAVDAVGGPGEHSTGTFQATWDETNIDPEGDNTYELVEQPGALACAFDFVQD